MEQHAHKMGYFYLTDMKVIECPQCKKMFNPATEHSYYAGDNKKKLVCSYNCMREWDREHPIKLKDCVKKNKRADGG